MRVAAVRWIRKMRGGSQAHLIEADDGYYYIVKFQNNPQHQRILVNELLSSILLEYLNISAPETAILDVHADFLAANPQVYFSVGSGRLAVQPGCHFGSRYPGDPSRAVVYDFLPDALLPRVFNDRDFLGILAFDKWVSNTDGRQTIFYAAKVQTPGEPTYTGYVVRMIDHGCAFSGPDWSFPDLPLAGLYARTVVYKDVRSLQDFDPWLTLIRHFPEEVIDRAWKSVPREWLDHDDAAYQHLLERLFERRKRVPQLLQDCQQSSVVPFPNWTRLALVASGGPTTQP